MFFSCSENLVNECTERAVHGAQVHVAAARSDALRVRVGLSSSELPFPFLRAPSRVAGQGLRWLCPSWSPCPGQPVPSGPLQQVAAAHVVSTAQPGGTSRCLVSARLGSGWGLLSAPESHPGLPDGPSPSPPQRRQFEGG